MPREIIILQKWSQQVMQLLKKITPIMLYANSSKSDFSLQIFEFEKQSPQHLQRMQEVIYYPVLGGEYVS